MKHVFQTRYLNLLSLTINWRIRSTTVSIKFHFWENFISMLQHDIYRWQNQVLEHQRSEYYLKNVLTIPKNVLSKRPRMNQFKIDDPFQDLLFQWIFNWYRDSRLYYEHWIDNDRNKLIRCVPKYILWKIKDHVKYKFLNRILIRKLYVDNHL